MTTERELNEPQTADWKVPPNEKDKKVMPVPDTVSNSYAGDYFLDGDTITVSHKGTQQLLTVNRSQVFTIYYTSPTEFFSKDIPLEFIIEKDAAGKLSGFYFMQEGKKMTVRKL